MQRAVDISARVFGVKSADVIGCLKTDFCVFARTSVLAYGSSLHPIVSLACAFRRSTGSVRYALHQHAELLATHQFYAARFSQFLAEIGGAK
jgi:hypothetical protein